MITVGTDSYITLAEAESILLNFFDTENWDSATDPNKETALKQATRNIDAQRLRFAKYLSSQTLEFPRSTAFECNGESLGVVTDAVKIAQALEALSIFDERASSSTAKADMEKGIVSRGTKSASVSYDAEVMKSVRAAASRPLSDKAKSYLRIWIKNTFARV